MLPCIGVMVLFIFHLLQLKGDIFTVSTKIVINYLFKRNWMLPCGSAAGTEWLWTLDHEHSITEGGQLDSTVDFQDYWWNKPNHGAQGYWTKIMSPWVQKVNRL